MMKINRLFLLAAFIMLSCVPSAKSQTSAPSVIYGEVKSGIINDVNFWIYRDNGLTIERKKVEVADSRFSLQVDDVVDFVDLEIFAEGTVFGAHLTNADTLFVTLFSKDTMNYFFDYAFRGKSAEMSYFMADVVAAYHNFVTYLIDPITEERISYEEGIARLKKNDAEFRAIHQSRLNKYYANWIDSWYNRQMFTITESDENREDECRQMISKIDPNNPMSMVTGLDACWLRYQAPQEVPKHSVRALMMEMDAVESKVTFSPVKQRLAKMCADEILSKPGQFDKSESQQLWQRFLKLAKDYPDLVEAYEKKYEAMQQLSIGNPAPDITLQKPDGSSVRLSSLFGKLIYIDVWATWCRPCCMEIPHMEKLVEHFKDNDKVVFISVSTDKNQQAWLDKIQNDNPQWPQFRLTEDQDELFCSQWNIVYIPRFLMIDKNGKVLNVNAPRPSDEKLIPMIEEAIK